MGLASVPALIVGCAFATVQLDSRTAKIANVRSVFLIWLTSPLWDTSAQQGRCLSRIVESIEFSGKGGKKITQEVAPAAPPLAVRYSAAADDRPVEVVDDARRGLDRTDDRRRVQIPQGDVAPHAVPPDERRISGRVGTCDCLD